MIKINITKIIKKNIAIIIPGLIAAVAVILLVPIIFMRGKINDNLEQSKRTGQNVESALRSVVSIKQYEIVKAYEDRHAQDANDIHNLAVQTTQRELLSYKIFPEPNETSTQIFNEFKKTYITAFAKLIKDMNALDAPTDIEVRNQAGTGDSTADGRGSGRVVSSSSAGDDKGNDKIIELVCKRRSEEIPVYANPQVFSGYGFWDNWEYFGTENAVRDCWYCQLAYWIHKDIVDSIKKINEGSTSVSKSSVKRLLGIRFRAADAAVADSTGTTASANLTNATELPIYITSTGGQLCTPWTNRTSDTKNDIIHFSIAVIVKADDVLKFMDILCSEKEHYFSGYEGQEQQQKFKHNQITILQSNIESVDRQSANHARYRYGQDAVVHLNLICEYLLNREGYNAIKPKTVTASQLDQSGAPTPGSRFERPVAPSRRPSGSGFSPSERDY
jgi:hypothetical protein